MCFIILVNRESVNRYWEWKLAGRERRRKFLQKILLCLRPIVNRNQHEESQQMDYYIEDGKLLRYASKTSLLLTKEVVK
jgi:hypothetical protein